jgi:zinc metalloprotease ZmpA
MKLLHGKAAYLVAVVAAAVSVAGAAAVQAQPSGKVSPDKVLTAEARVVANSARFGFGPGQQLKATGVYSDTMGSAIRFDRTYRGLPVVGGDFVVHLTPSGAYRYGNGLKVVGLPASLHPSVSAAAAGATAAGKVGYPVASRSTSLVIFSRTHFSALAWQVKTSSKGGMRGDVSYVSARTGRTLSSWPTVDNDTGTGKTLYSGTVSLQDKARSSGMYVLKDLSRGKQTIWDAHNQEITAGTLFKDGNNVWGDGTETSRETAGADAAYGLANTWDFYLNVFGRNGIGDDGVAARGFVHVYSNYVNASWSDACFCMRFGDGSAGSGISALTSLDVSGHEMTHGVTSRTAKLVYSGESGGLNESTSDVFGTMVEWYANNANDVPDYVIGEEIFRSYDPAVNYIRRMDQPSVDGASKDCWYSGVGGVDVHYSSGVGNHLFYLLSEGSGAKTINGIDYDSPTCNGSTITGIGHDKAAAIWYKALTENWVSTTNYHDARVGTLQAASDLYGASSTEYKRVNKAWAAVSVTP